MGAFLCNDHAMQFAIDSILVVDDAYDSGARRHFVVGNTSSFHVMDRKKGRGQAKNARRGSVE